MRVPLGLTTSTVAVAALVSYSAGASTVATKLPVGLPARIQERGTANSTVSSFACEGEGLGPAAGNDDGVAAGVLDHQGHVGGQRGGTRPRQGERHLVQLADDAVVIGRQGDDRLCGSPLMVSWGIALGAPPSVEADHLLPTV